MPPGGRPILAWPATGTFASAICSTTRDAGRDATWRPDITPTCASEPAGQYELWRGADQAKDQSYVLHVLGQAELAQALFPVGEYTKPQVRSPGGRTGLAHGLARLKARTCVLWPTATTGASCATGRRRPSSPGPILDRAGPPIGRRTGACPTIRSGSGVGWASRAPRPLYVLALDRARNALIVGPAEELGSDRLRTGPVNWVSGEAPSGPLRAGVQIRYHTPPAPALITPLPDGGAEVQFTAPLRGAMPGQAAVFYAGDRCLGGGVIRETNAATWNNSILLYK